MRVTFPNVLRAQPIVLTAHQMAELSEVAGCDVSSFLADICGERFEAKTLGQLMRLLRARLLEEKRLARSEKEDLSAWCAPGQSVAEMLARAAERD
jgi:hypothetical protein